MNDKELEKAIINALEPMKPEGKVVIRLVAVAKAYKTAPTPLTASL
jgi:hypothetical protein